MDNNLDPRELRLAKVFRSSAIACLLVVISSLGYFGVTIFDGEDEVVSTRTNGLFRILLGSEICK